MFWIGAGLGALAGRPTWAGLLRDAVESADADDETRTQLDALLARGQGVTVLDWLRRHSGPDSINARLSAPNDNSELPAELVRFGSLRWRACMTTIYPDVLARAREAAGRTRPRISRDANKATLGDHILSVSPVDDLRRDHGLRELVEESVRTGYLVLLGFERDDPDLHQILALLAKAKAKTGAASHLFVSELASVEAESLAARAGVEVHTLGDAGLAGLIEQMAAACEGEAEPSRADQHLTALELSRILRSVPPRVDLGVDAAFTVDPHEVDRLVDALPGGLESLPTRDLLRLGSVWLAHAGTSGKAQSRWHKRARKAFQELVAHDADVDTRDVNLARFNLAMLALGEGDEEAARTGLEAAAEHDSNLALISPRFALTTVRGRVGSRIWIECQDRARDNSPVAIEVGIVGRAVSPAERSRFSEQVESLAAIDHPALVRVREGVAEGRVFGVISDIHEGVPLSRLLDEPLALDKAFEVLGPLMEVLAVAHAKGLVHRNLHPRHVLITPDGAKLRGFGFLPLVSWSRPAIVRENLGYAAPELFAGGVPSPASDTYAIAAMVYRCVTGTVPLGSIPRPSSIVQGIDMRLDALLVEAMHPDPSKRPDPKGLRTEIATILTTPHKFDQVEAKPEPEPAKPAEPAKPTGPVKIVEPDDPNDLDAWKWILERKPAHLPAREAINRIEREARSAGRWDQVAEVLDVRARLSQAETEKVVLLRELGEIYEQRLGAPSNALDAVLQLVDTISVKAQVPLTADLERLAKVTGRWAAVAEKLRAVGQRTPDADDQMRLLIRSAQIYVEEVGELDRAIAVYEDALDYEPENLDLQRAALVAYRKADRPAELATGLLTIAELETGAPRHEALLEAADVLGELGEHEGALEAADHVREEDPDHERALELCERWASELDRWEVLAPVLAARADKIDDPAEASELRRRAAAIMRERLDDEAGAIEQYRRLVERDRSDGDTARVLADLLRPTAAGEGSQAASAREGLIDALSVLTELEDGPEAKAELLAEAASFLDRETDGAERAADCREQIVEGLPASHGLVGDAIAGLTRYYRAQSQHRPLAELLSRRADDASLPEAERVGCYRQLHELASGALADAALEHQALEALVALDSTDPRWRDMLIDKLSDAGDQSRAEELLRQRLADAEHPEDRAAMLVTVARMRERAGALDEAEAQVREALELDDQNSAAWALLREILETRERPLEALEAQVRAAQTSTDSREKVRGLFGAAQTWIETLSKPERALPLLREVVEIDPHHQAATGLYVERLVERSELAEAWPHAQRWVEQTRASQPDDREQNAHVHALAGRCALAVHDKDSARVLLRDAKQFDPRNREVGRALAELELESENWAAALKAYQGLAIQSGEGDDARSQADIYLRMGQARHGLGEPAKALQMLDRALDLDPTYVEAARFGVELADSPVRAVEARQRLITVLEAELDSFAAEDERRDDREQDLLDLRLALATTLADELNRPGEAVEQIRAVLAKRPNDIPLLHRALDLFSNAELWSDAVEVLDRLAKLQDHGPIQAKYRYAAVSLMRAHKLDMTGVIIRARLLGVLEADPLHAKAFKGACDLLEAAQDWRELSKVLRSRLKITPEDQVEARVTLLDDIAGLYERHLDDKRTAMIAYEQAITLAQPLVKEDDPRQAGRRNRVVALSVQLGDDAIDKGIEQVQAMIGDNPLDYDSYHRLVELYLKAKQRDAAIVVSRTLRFLKQADEAEIDLAAELGENYQPPRGSISRKQWRDVILPDHPSSRLSDLYGLLWPVMAARGGLNHASVGLDRGARESVSMQASGLTRWVAYMSQVIDMPPPDLFLRKGLAGGFKVTALGDAKGVYPTLIAGDDALARQGEAALAFRTGRAIARVHPHLIGSALLPSVSSLRDAIYGAVSLTHPQVAVPKELREAARGWAETIKKMLPPARLDDLRKAVSRVIESGGADTKTWLRGCDHAAARAGYLLCDSIDVAARISLAGGGAGNSVDGRELIKGLIAFSVSGRYLGLRRSLKIGQ